jgi:hypothetical protein
MMDLAKYRPATKIVLKLLESHIPQVKPSNSAIFPDNDSLQNRVDVITLFLARVIFPNNYSSIISKDVFAAWTKFYLLILIFNNTECIIKHKISLCKIKNSKFLITYLRDVGYIYKQDTLKPVYSPESSYRCLPPHKSEERCFLKYNIQGKLL